MLLVIWKLFNYLTPFNFLRAKDVESRKKAAEQALAKATEVTESLKAEKDMRRMLEEEVIQDKALLKDLTEEVNSLRVISKVSLLFIYTYLLSTSNKLDTSAFGW